MGLSILGVTTSLTQWLIQGGWNPLELNRIKKEHGKIKKKVQEIHDSLPGTIEKEVSAAVMSRKSPGSSELGGDSKV